MRTELLALGLWLIQAFFNPAVSPAQTNNSCDNLRTGTFYRYSPQQLSYYVYFRNGDTQMEIDRLQKDTIFYKIQWNDCSYTLKYLRSSRPAYPDAGRFHTKEKAVLIKITEQAERYYVYEKLVDKKKVGVDTIWREEQRDRFLDKKIIASGFPGGDSALYRYLTKKVNMRINETHVKIKKEGICNIRFDINPDGTLSNIEAISMANTKIAEIAIYVLEHCPKWIPASIDGVAVRSVRVQPFVIVKSPDLTNLPGQ